jgi:hypothetical protein
VSTIATLLDRARLGVPLKRQALTIVPLHLEPNGKHGRERGYVPLGEAIRGGGTQITEISDAGSVPLLAIRNQSDVAVFILDGEELKGAKQNRIVNLSILVPARTVLPIPVSCVERGRWSYRTRDFDVSPYAMFAGGRAQQADSVTRCMMATGKRDGDQARVWQDVDAMLTACGSASPTSAMHDLYEDRRGSLDDLLKGLAPLPDQAGAVFAVGGRVVGMELFESPEVFGSYFPKLVRSYALDALVSRSNKELLASDADELLDEIRRAHAQRFTGLGLGEDLRISDRNLAGGALLWDDRLVHLAAFRNHGRTAAPAPPTTRPAPAPNDPRWWSFMRRWFNA